MTISNSNPFNTTLFLSIVYKSDYIIIYRKTRNKPHVCANEVYIYINFAYIHSILFIWESERYALKELVIAYSTFVEGF